MGDGVLITGVDACKQKRTQRESLLQLAGPVLQANAPLFLATHTYLTLTLQ